MEPATVTAHDPDTRYPATSYHWTPALQRDFLAHLAITGSVQISAARVSMSPGAAYQLRHKPQGAAFRLGWAAAVLIARARLADELLDRAIWGIEETYERGPAEREGYHFHKRRRQDPRLGLAMLARLDRAVETRARAGEEMLAQIIAGDWDGFLSLFAVETDGEVGGHNAALALWLAGRDNRANPVATLWKDSAIANEVARFSADADPEPEAEPTPEEEAAAMSVWPDGESGELRTNFPPPEDYVGIEEGEFGEPDYERTLDADEQEAFDAAFRAAIAPLRAAGEAARRAYFGLPAPANDAGGAPGAAPIRHSVSPAR
ncbi:hypothetical protein [Sphingopyxis sp.]|uniref:hypothetical protein n=1 Tax=Sphingopyxis sp. TaxID=1908224 RepID=UPI0035B3ED8D